MTNIETSEFSEFFKPTILSTENAEEYERLENRMIESIQPLDFTERVFVAELVANTWDIWLYRRQKTKSVERQFASLAVIHSKRKALHEEMKEKEAARQDAHKRSLALALNQKLGWVLDLVPDVDAILEKPSPEGHSIALQQGIRYHQQIDELLGVAIKRRNDTLRMIDLHRCSLGKQAREAITNLEKDPGDGTVLEAATPSSPSGTSGEQAAPPLVPAE